MTNILYDQWWQRVHVHKYVINLYIVSNLLNSILIDIFCGEINDREQLFQMYIYKFIKYNYSILCELPIWSRISALSSLWYLSRWQEWYNCKHSHLNTYFWKDFLYIIYFKLNALEPGEAYKTVRIIIS